MAVKKDLVPSILPVRTRNSKEQEKRHNLYLGKRKHYGVGFSALARSEPSPPKYKTTDER